MNHTCTLCIASGIACGMSNSACSTSTHIACSGQCARAQAITARWLQRSAADLLRPRRYNTLMKLFFIGATLALIYLMRFHRTIRSSYDRVWDTFRYEILVGASVLLATTVHARIRPAGWVHWTVEVRSRRHI